MNHPITEYKTLSVEQRDKVVIISLNRPNDANGMNHLLAQELGLAAQACDGNPSIKAVVLTGMGRFFCAGGDVKAMAGFGDDVAVELKRLADDLHRAISTFSRMKAPLIVAVNGVAAGAGLSLAASGDLVIASEAASFTMSYTAVGLSPDGSSSYFLPRLIGVRKTQELMYTNRKLTAQEALDWGLVNKVVPAASLMDEALLLADMFARGSAESNARVKKLLLETFSNGLETQMELEGRYIAECAAGSNGREGIQAFVEKRRPQFD